MDKTLVGTPDDDITPASRSDALNIIDGPIPTADRAIMEREILIWQYLVNHGSDTYINAAFTSSSATSSFEGLRPPRE
jgi:hypothetical protein